MFLSNRALVWYLHVFAFVTVGSAVKTNLSSPSEDENNLPRLLRVFHRNEEEINRLCPLINITFSCGHYGDDSPYCSCDPETCMAYGDCCHDVAFNGSEAEIRRYSWDLANNKNRLNQTSCVTLPGMSNAVKMVTSCPPNADSTISMECFNAGRTANIDPKRDLPVWSKTSRVVYRNLFCALCHNDTEVEPWLLNFHCKSPDVIDSLPRNSTDKLSLLRQIVSLPSCSILFKQRSHMEGDMHMCRTNANKNSDNITVDFLSVDLWYQEWMAAFQPFEYGNLIQTCNVTGLWKNYDDEQIARCGAYHLWVVGGLPPNLFSATTSTPSASESTTEVHKLDIPDMETVMIFTEYRPDERSHIWSSFGLFANVDCALCNGIILQNDSLICPQTKANIRGAHALLSNKVLSGVQPFSMLMDFGPDFKMAAAGKRIIQEGCPAGYVKRKGYEKCRKIICPAGMIPSGTDCIDQFPEINLNCSFKVPVKLYAFSVDATHPVSCKDLIESIANAAGGRIPDEIQCEYTEDRSKESNGDTFGCKLEPHIVLIGIFKNRIIYQACAQPFLFKTLSLNEQNSIYLAGSALWKAISSSAASAIESSFGEHLQKPWDSRDLINKVVVRHKVPEHFISISGTLTIELNSTLQPPMHNRINETERCVLGHLLNHFESNGVSLIFAEGPISNQISVKNTTNRKPGHLTTSFTNISFTIEYAKQNFIDGNFSLETIFGTVRVYLSNIVLSSLTMDIPYFMHYPASEQTSLLCPTSPYILCPSFNCCDSSIPNSKQSDIMANKSRADSRYRVSALNPGLSVAMNIFEIPQFVQNKQDRRLPNVTKISEDTLNCSRVRLNRTEFTGDDNMITLSFNGLILNQTDFIKDGEGVLICVDDFLEENRNRTPESSSVLVQVIVSYSLLSISVLCLVFTIITYLLFTDLRKGLPGKNSFNLCVTLMLAQLLFLLNYVPSQNNAVCKAFAIVMHYWWLCSFAWMTTCAFHMCWTFTYPFSIAQFDSSDIRKWHIKYCLISYCSPLVIVIPCVVLDFCECSSVSIGYGTGGSSCWIGNTMALAYSFALPVGITILLQLVFFIRTAIALRPVPNVERCGPDYNQFLVYCKLSTLMGFGWIFAFIAAFTSLSLMWYLFYVFSCLQGAFICFSYIMKKSVLQRYRKYCRNKSPGHISSTTSMNMTTMTSAKSVRSATYVAAAEVAV